MNRDFMAGFLDELEKQGFFEERDQKDLQRKLKAVQKGLAKTPQIEVIPAERGMMEEKAVRPGSTMESAKSMAGDVVRKLKTLRAGRGK
jgi:hypothetical protein